MIRDSLQKSICHDEDVIPGAQVVSSMPTVTDIENIPQPSDAADEGIYANLSLVSYQCSCSSQDY